MADNGGPEGEAFGIPAQDPGPFLATAVFCEKVLREEDGVFSLIRIYDRIAAPVPIAEPPNQEDDQALKGPSLPVVLTMFVSLRVGQPMESHQLHLRSESPTGRRHDLSPIDVDLSGEERGFNAVMQLNAQFLVPGLHWFDIEFDGARLTRVPLTVVFAQVGPAPVSAPA